jgi:transcriptional regulator with XRE-family HTH domain
MGYQAADKLGWSESKISRIERMRTGVSVPDIERMLDLYGVTGADRDEILDLAERSAEPAYKGSPRMAALGIYREAAATADLWAPSVVPLLFRTRAYAEAIAVAAAEVTAELPSAIAAELRTITAWQGRVGTRQDPLTVRAVLDVTVLARRVGRNKEIMRGQIEHLVWLAGRPNVDLTVLPLDAAGLPGMDGFTLLRFGLAGGLPLDDVVLSDDPVLPRMTDEAESAHRCRRAIKELTLMSVDPDDAFAAALARL